ncbi:MAG: 3-phosphoshikimate 1-carboxyvinyltransferase [Dehalococcoidia bacterium]|nr:3-phosphoshikimate 1-carboxyvinyltransferase [Dehalococcoidia bacterium]
MIKKLKAPSTLSGKLTLPGDKSISHRAVIFNGIARGESKIENFPSGEDCWTTVACMRSMGVKIKSSEGKTDDGKTLVISGVGEEGLKEPGEALDAKNSGTTMRLLAGLLASQPFLSIITGDKSLRSRPMERIIKPLRAMGAEIYSKGNNSKAPLIINGKQLQGITYSLPIASAQVKSALILAALHAKGTTILVEPSQSRDHTERLIKNMGGQIEFGNLITTITPQNSPLKSLDICIPGDISSASYWLVAGAIHPNARIKLSNVGVNPSRTGIIDVLQKMGANIKIENQRWEKGEPIADILVKTSKLRGVQIGGDLIPRIIDEIPIITVAASVAQTGTVIKDAAELRFKETDRITTTAQELSKMGASIEELSNGMIIKGGTQLQGTECDSKGDHRLAMTLGIAALVAKGETIIHNAEAVNISYSTFWQDMETLCPS